MNFADLGLSDELLRSLADAGYSEPTPIQAQAIPSVLMMRDMAPRPAPARRRASCCR
jgi:superfamily II DNA/RNA helicase